MIKKIHHISNIVKHPQENIDFYSGLLGLRLIKKAVNFDSASTYHFYYGNHQADSGTVITSFPLGRDTKDGILGGGMTSSTYYAIPKGSFDFWFDRLVAFNLDISIIERFGKKHLVFKDYLGIVSELVESDQGIKNLHEFNGVTKNEAIRGFYGAEIYSTKPEETKDFFIKYLNIKMLDEDDNSYRLSYNDKIGNIIDINKETRARGRLSKGTVHHIAFEIDTKENLIKLREKLVEDGFNPSDVRDRNFFKAIYVREPGGTIIEVSTKDPGFSKFEIDDQAKELYLPKHYEHLREELEKTLTPVFVREISELKKYHYEGLDEYNAYINHHNNLKRINELAKISKTRDLTEAEINERTILRQAHLKSIKDNVRGLADNIEIEDNSHLNKMINKREVN